MNKRMDEYSPRTQVKYDALLRTNRNLQRELNDSRREIDEFIDEYEERKRREPFNLVKNLSIGQEITFTDSEFVYWIWHSFDAYYKLAPLVETRRCDKKCGFDCRSIHYVITDLTKIKYEYTAETDKVDELFLVSYGYDFLRRNVDKHGGTSLSSLFANGDYHIQVSREWNPLKRDSSGGENCLTFSLTIKKLRDRRILPCDS